MASIEKRKGRGGKSVYRVKIRLKGREPVTGTFERLTDAKRWAQKIEAAMREGRYFPTSMSRSKTLADAIDRFRSDVLPEMPKMQRLLKPQFAFWERQIGHLPLAEITMAVISQERDKLRRERKVRKKDGQRASGQISASTVNRYLCALSLVLGRAAGEWEWMEVNPVTKVRKYEEPRGRTRYLDDSERRKLLKACKRIDDDLYMAVVLSLSTGARKMEVMSLRWKDVDFSRALIILADTKNKETRSISLQGHALELMKAKSKIREIRSNLVFPGKVEGKSKDLQFHWKRALYEAEIVDFRWHDLRHSAASYLAMNGASLMEIAEILGHKTLSMVQRYSHLSPEHLAGVMSKMNAAIFE